MGEEKKKPTDAERKAEYDEAVRDMQRRAPKAPPKPPKDDKNK